jgi:hypothetical protein
MKSFSPIEKEFCINICKKRYMMGIFQMVFIMVWENNLLIIKLIMKGCIQTITNMGMENSINIILVTAISAMKAHLMLIENTEILLK